MKFAPKLTALFIIIGAIIVAIMLTIAYFQVEKILESEIRVRMENRVFFTMDAISRFLYERLSDIKMIAADPVISSENATAEQVTERLIFFRNAYKYYVSFSFFNLERIRIADTVGLHIGEQNRMTRYWEDILSGKVSAASDVHIAKDLQVPVVYFASAVNNKEGRAIGVVVARIPTNRLFEMVKGSTKIQEEEEEIDIVNKDGLLIYSNHNREGILKENLPEWESIKIAQREKIFGSVKHRCPGEKEMKLHALCREQGHLDFKGNDWTIIFTVPARAIFGPVNNLLKILTIMFLAMLPGLALVAYFFSKTVTQPLTQLSFAAGEIGKGKLDTAIEVKSKDEFGSLANTLSQMVSDLKKTTVSIDNLNKEITERKKAEENVKLSKERGELIYKTIPSAIFTVDKEKRITSWNKKAKELTGYTAEEVLGKECYLFALKPCTEKCGLYSEEVVKPIVGKECTISRKDEKERTILKNVDYLKDTDGNVIGGVETFEDITGRKKAEEELRAAYKKLKETQQELIQVSKMAAMGQLAAGISHELNQPLTGIKGFTQAVLADLEKESPFRSDLNKIVEQTDRIDAIIKNVRFFARKSDFNMVETDINQVISESLMLLSHQLKMHNIRVIQELGLDFPKIQGDSNQLQQAFINIINNARDAILGLNRPEGGEIRIRTTLAQDKKHIEIDFQDTGGGIPKENHQNIFTPFFTTKSPKGGMGLGLSITYRIIENHLGRIGFQSKGGEGTTIRIVLQVKERRYKIKQS